MWLIFVDRWGELEEHFLKDKLSSGLVRQFDDNSYEYWKALIVKHEVSEEKQESLNEATNRWNNCSINETSQDPDIWFNVLYNLNLMFKNIKAKYEKYED